VKPGLLEIQAFGPYAQRQVVDFACLEGADLVLIEGPTGAGKTTLFDAISYALYGRVPGARADALHQLRCAHPAASGLETLLSFSFELRGKRYRVERQPEQRRPKKRGEGDTTQPAQARFYEVAEDGRETLRASKVTEVDQRVIELTGLSAKQ
jgi:exonuclease SbcC